MKELVSWFLGLVGITLLGFALRPLWQTLNERVFAWMNKIYLKPMWVKKGQGEKVRLVRSQSKVLAWQALVRRGLVGLGIGIAAGLSLTLVVFIVRAVLNINQYLTTGDQGPAWWILATTVFLSTVPVLIYTYFIETWNCQNARYIFLTGSSWLLRIKAPEGTVSLSFGPTVLMEETKMGSPGEKIGEEAPTFLGRLYDGLLWRWRGIAYIFLPSRVFGAADKMEYVEWAFGVFKILQFLAKEARERQGQVETIMKALWSARLEETKEGGLWVTATGDEVQEIVRAFNQLMPEGEAFDLTKVQDPGEFDVEQWHKGLGEVEEVAAARPSELDLSAFQPYPSES